jgi:hypothetical protein
MQRLVLVGRYLIVIKDDMCPFALARGRSSAGTTSGAASSTARRGTTVATCRTAAYRDASTACWWAATTNVTTSGAARTTEPRDDHVVGLVAPLHWSDADVVQRGHYRQ